MTFCLARNACTHYAIIDDDSRFIYFIFFCYVCYGFDKLNTGMRIDKCMFSKVYNWLYGTFIKIQEKSPKKKKKIFLGKKSKARQNSSSLVNQKPIETLFYFH